MAAPLVLWALVGCAEAEGADPAPHSEIKVTDAAVRLVDEAKADFVLYVSNQSFDDEEVRLTVRVDGVTVVDGGFHVEGQHNWLQYPLALTSGEHEITAESDSGATLRKSFQDRPGKTRYAVIEHWTEGDSARLTWRSQWQPMGFA